MKVKTNAKRCALNFVDQYNLYFRGVIKLGDTANEESMNLYHLIFLEACTSFESISSSRNSDCTDSMLLVFVNGMRGKSYQQYLSTCYLTFRLVKLSLFPLVTLIILILFIVAAEFVEN